MEDIAVVGLGLRFPGNATNPEDLWDALVRGESQWSEFPKDRLNIDGYYHPSGDRQGSISFRGAHFMAGNVAAFDAPFFSISAEDAIAIDPQQRLLLETSFEALENAGIRREDVEGSDTAVYVGSFVKDYEQICLRDPDWQPQYAATGNGIAIMANRISHFYNFHGPSVTVDTGCSGSLVAVHLAAQSLRTGETSLAIAAGAGMILTPNTIMPMTALNFLSPDGKCFTFDSRANGYGRGEGIGVVVLKRLSDALRNNDTIRAVIRGTRVNQDGRTPGITLPSKEAQVSNIRSIYESAGLDPSKTAYVECHGTGTQAGDWRELKAISESLGAVRDPENPIVVGSIKPNIGHLEGAAGVAGLIKGVLILEHGKIPPNINFESGNPDIDFKSWKVRVPTAVMDWPLTGLRRVSVNCFGFGGTNAHAILDEAPRYLSARGLMGNHNSMEPKTPERNATTTRNADGDTHQRQRFEPQLLLYSSHEKAGIRRVLDSHLPYLSSIENQPGEGVLRNYAYTLACRRSNLEWKYATVSTSHADLISTLKAADTDSIQRGGSNGKQPKLCFVFSGQGAQYAQMGRGLIAYQQYRLSIYAASLYMQAVLQSSFNLWDEIWKGPQTSRISEPEIAQPATTALQIALVDLLKSFDITPAYVVGHSSGEIAAAYASGALSREAAWEVAFYRGRATSQLRHKAPDLEGAMMAVGMPLEDVENYLQSNKRGAEIACINSPRSVTIAGPLRVLHEIAEEVESNGIFHRLLRINVAYHSSQMRLVEDDYRKMLGHIKASKPRTAKMFSSVTGEPIDRCILDGRYWAANMVSRVRFMPAVQSMMALPQEARPDVILDLGPRSGLKSPTTEILADLGCDSSPKYHSILDGVVDDSVSLLTVVGHLWILGCKINLQSVVSRGSGRRPLKCLVDLPPYPWNHNKSYWHESHLGRANRFREFGRQDFIGSPTADAISFEPRWRGFLRISENPWLQDHQVQKTIVYPAAGMVTMALEGISQLTKDKLDILGYEITNMRIQRAMIIPSSAHGLETAMNFKQQQISSCDQSEGPVSFEFTIYSKHLDKPWEENANGSIRIRTKRDGCETMFNHLEHQFNSVENRCTEELVPRQLYELLDIVGMNYGALFRNISYISKGDNACVSKICVPDTKSKMPAHFEYSHLIHPATLDAMFQTLFGVDNTPMVPTYIGSFFVSGDITRDIGSEFRGYAVAERVGLRDVKADLAMTQSEWQIPSIVVSGLQFTDLTTSTAEVTSFLPNHRNLCTELVWEQEYTGIESLELSELLKRLAHKHPGLSVLQVGGSPCFAKSVLDILAPRPDETPWISRYSVATGADGSALEILSRVQGTPLEPFVESRTLDGSEMIPEYHLILAFCGQIGDLMVLDLKRHLSPGGAFLFDAMKNGYREFEPVYHRYQTDGKDVFTTFQQYQQQPALAASESVGVVMLLPDMAYMDSKLATLINALADSMTELHPNVVVSFMFPREIETENPNLERNIFFSFLEFCEPVQSQSSIFHWSQQDFDMFHILQQSAKGVVWITQGANMKPVNPRAAPIITLARTLMSEDPANSIVTIDLDPDTELDGNVRGRVRSIIAAFEATFMMKNTSAPREMEYAEQGGKLFVPRLVPITPFNKMIENGVPLNSERLSFHNPKMLRLDISRLSLAEDGPVFSTADDAEPSLLEVEIIFENASIGQADVDVAMGQSTETKLGVDVSGILGRIGKEASNLHEGDRVAAITPGGAVQNRLHIDRRFVKKWLFDIPLSHLVSAYYAIFLIGRLGRGKSVLIQAGAGAFGFTAVKTALQGGAQVFATVMGSGICQQRAALEGLGIDSEHILEADSDDFVRTILGLTRGKGVDVVYNPTQSHVEANLNCVRKSGVIVQFASKSPCPSPIRIPSSSASYVSFDLVQLMREDPDFVAELLDQALSFVQTTNLDLTLPPGFVHTIELSRIREAFQLVNESPFLGHVSLEGGPKTRTMVEVGIPTYTKPLRSAVTKDGTYLLAGGLGGLGRSICRLLVENGAKHVAFLSRSGASSKDSGDFIKSLVQRGVDARVYQVDICDIVALRQVVKAKVALEMPPIRGVFQCAAVIKDAVFDNMSYSDWQIAFRPKTVGSENLMNMVLSTGSDPFFIFLASSAGVIGNRGQANYAAGNSYLDALARNHRLHGKHAVSIDLGPVLGAGMLADDEEILDMLRASGFYGIRHQDFLKTISHAITMEISPGVPMPPQVIMGVGTGGLMLQNQPADPYWSRTALYGYLNLMDMPPPDLSVVGGSVKVDMMSMLASCTSATAAAEIVCTGLRHMLAKAMNMLPEEVDSGKLPRLYGVDSLVAVGVRNWVFRNCGVEVSVFDVLSERTVEELASDIARKGKFGIEKS